jgi:glycosyltransferase involved in cell wall biosynthesis
VIVDLERAGVEFREGRGHSFKIAYSDSCSLLDKIKPDLVHIQGMWKLSTHAMNVAAAKRNVPIVISPHGMLDPWALKVKRWKKRLGMMLYQSGDLRRASAFQVMCEAEASHVREFGLTAPTFVVPIGVECPTAIGMDDDSHVTNHQKTVLFLSRLHPGKGLLILAEAWAKLRPNGWRVLVVGPDEGGHKAEVEARLSQLGVSDGWEFYGQVNDVEKWNLYRMADLFVHPSASENFCLSIAEALASGLPVITTKGCPWSIIDGKCGWWIDRTVDALCGALRSAIEMPIDQRAHMGEVAKAMIRDNFSWPVVAKKLVIGYETVFLSG